MRRITDQLTDAADHLALDEAILLEAEENQGGEVLRVWEFTNPVVVAGRSTRVGDEVEVDFCSARGIPVLRRCSGGASVVGGPGCLMYSVILSFDRNPRLSRIDVAHRYVMNRMLEAVQQQLPDVKLQGTCDLTWQNRKFSGNSLRIARGHLLYHGTILYDFDLSLITRCLREAPRQPAYREGRQHGEFITNLPIEPAPLCSALEERFEVTGQGDADSLLTRIRDLRLRRYDDDAWHFRH